MNKLILTGIAALALTGTAFAAESGDSYPKDKTELFNVQRGIVTQQAPAQAPRFHAPRGHQANGMKDAVGYATDIAEREASYQ